MSKEFGNDFMTIIDDDGNEFNLELLDTIDYNGETFPHFSRRIWTRTTPITALYS